MRLYRRGLMALVILAGWAAAAPAEAGKPKRYNVIAIVTDDQGHWAVGAYGNKEIKTPNMDKLAKQGARFLNAFTATPVCSPSRASYLTGKWGTQVQITDWISPAEGAAGVGLPGDTITWMQVLQKHGYVTGLIGKWHLGLLPQYHPTKHGFTHFVGFLGGGNTPMNPTLEVNGKDKKFNGAEPDIIVDQAIDFLKQNKDRPFALAIHFRAPHLPYGPVPKEDSEPFKNLDPTIPKFKGIDVQQVKNWTREYYASVHSVDRNLGRLLAMLDELGLAENTIIIFTSDHGYMIGHHGLHTKGNANWIVGGVTGPKRPNMFDLSMRVPLIVRWPGVVKPGTEIKEMVSNIDTFASVLGMLKVPLPEKYPHHGLDFSPLLRGEKAPWRDAVFGQYDLHNGGLAYMRSIRTTRYNLVRHFYANGLDELYDLDNDPDETINLYDNPQHRKIRDELLQRLSAWQRSIDDPLLRDPRNKQ
jgi:uncharacterized sulfatase